jgi:outer membrane lipoprotein SlyB
MFTTLGYSDVTPIGSLTLIQKIERSPLLMNRESKKQPLTIVLAIFLVTVFLGCSEPLTTREKGAAVGTFTGAGLGAIIGSATGHAGAGAGIGAAVGLIGGALIGDQIQERQKQQQELKQKMAEQQAEIDRAQRELEQLKQQEQAR